MDRQHRIEQMRQTDSVCFGDEPKQLAVAVEAPRLTLVRYLDAPLIRAIQDLVAHPTSGVLVGELERVVAVPLDVDDGNERFGKNSPYGDMRLQIFELHPRACSSGLTTRTDPYFCPSERSSEYSTSAPDAWAACTTRASQNEIR